MSTLPKKKLSVLKRARQSVKRNIRNRGVRTMVKTYIKKLQEAIASGEKDQMDSALRKVTKVISSAASKGVLHSNTASRYISRLSKRVNAALKKSAAA